MNILFQFLHSDPLNGRFRRFGSGLSVIKPFLSTPLSLKQSKLERFSLPQLSPRQEFILDEYLMGQEYHFEQGQDQPERRTLD
jgi:hypothetical protein